MPKWKIIFEATTEDHSAESVEMHLRDNLQVPPDFDIQGDIMVESMDEDGLVE